MGSYKKLYLGQKLQPFFHRKEEVFFFLATGTEARGIGASGGSVGIFPTNQKRERGQKEKEEIIFKKH